MPFGCGPPRYVICGSIPWCGCASPENRWTEKAPAVSNGYMLPPAIALLLVLQDPAGQIHAARQAFAKQAYADAVAELKPVVDAAKDSAELPMLVESSRLLAAVYREMGDPAKAADVLSGASTLLTKNDATDLRLAAVLDDLAAVQRAQSNTVAAIASIENAIHIRELHPESSRVELARDMTVYAMMKYQSAGAAAAIDTLQRAVQSWDTAMPGDPQSLTAIEALASAYREGNRFAEAEPLLRRSLRLREAVSGPEGAEVISTVDSLAYVEFGLGKMVESEALYKRLLALWVKNAGPTHPMVALTLDKMAENYAVQQRYEEAEKCAADALGMRAKTHLASLQQDGRLLIMQIKVQEAEDLYQRAIQIGELSKVGDEALDPLLRMQAKVLRELKRNDEAAAIEKRVEEAIDRRADREGRRPAPPNARIVPRP
jgi:tetratricopeptide (TPR) repeat protein